MNKWAPFFDHAAHVFQRQRSTQSVANFSIANSSIQLIFANQEFRNFLTPALMHLAVKDIFPDVTVYLWDDVSTGTQMIAPPWSTQDYLPKGEIAGWSNDRFCVSFQLLTSILVILDRETKTALYWTRDFRKIPYWEVGAPLLQLFQFWLSGRERAAVHAAAVGIETGAVLLVGRGGMGKSTTALASLQSPLLYAADDYCAVSNEEEGPRVHSLFNTGKTDPVTLKKLGIAFTPSGRPKELLFLYPEKSEKLRSSFPLRAICVPRVKGDAEATLVPCATAVALAALAPSSLFQLPGVGDGAFRAMAALVRRLPTYYLYLGSRLLSAPGVLHDFLLRETT